MRTFKDIIQKVENTADRFVLCLQRFDHVGSHRVLMLYLLSIDPVCRVLINPMTHILLEFREQQYRNERLISRDEVIQFRTHHGRQLHVPNVRTDFGRRSFFYFGSTFDSGVLKFLKTASRLQTFKLRFKEFHSKVITFLFSFLIMFAIFNEFLPS